jgi:RNA recognition motif-containing protein
MGTGTGNKRLYVGNISYQTTESVLKQAFEYGPNGNQKRKVVDIKMVTDRETRQFRGFAFVEMASVEEAADCITDWDGQDLEGRTLKVNEAQPKTSSNGRGGGDKRGYRRDSDR